MGLRDIINSLPEEQKAALMLAFDEGKTFVVEYEAGRFVGVNVDPSPAIVIDEKIKYWCSGRYVKGAA